jgi:L-threonylcarbamoyladenylate synthase
MNRLEKAAGHLRISAGAVVKRQRFHRIVFVSQSDTCRGPMAAELLRQKELKQEYVIDSRGMVVLFPEPPNQKAEAVMKSMQLTLSEHTAHAFSESEIGEDILILTFEEKQKEKLISEYGNSENIYTLCEFIGEAAELESPYGKPLQAYGESLEKIAVSIEKLAEELNSFTE